MSRLISSVNVARKSSTSTGSDVSDEESYDRSNNGHINSNDSKDGSFIFSFKSNNQSIPQSTTQHSFHHSTTQHPFNQSTTQHSSSHSLSSVNQHSFTDSFTHSLPSTTNRHSFNHSRSSTNQSPVSTSQYIDHVDRSSNSSSLLSQRALYKLNDENKTVNQCSCAFSLSRELSSLIRIHPNTQSSTLNKPTDKVLENNQSPKQILNNQLTNQSTNLLQAAVSPKSVMRSSSENVKSINLSSSQCDRGCCSVNNALHSLRTNMRSISHSVNQPMNLADVCFNVSGLTIAHQDMQPYKFISQPLTRSVSQPIQSLGSLEDYRAVSHEMGQSTSQMMYAHRVMLAARSPVFDRMFNGQCCESAQSPHYPTNQPMSQSIMTIDIPDITPVAFSALLDYIYEDVLPTNQSVNQQSIDPSHLPSLLYAAIKYDLPRLIGSTKQSLMHLSVNQSINQSINLWRALRSLHEDQLAESFKQFILSHASIMFRVNQSISQSINQSLEIVGHMTMTPAISQSVNQCLQRTFEEVINQSISRSINQSISRSINQSINQFEMMPIDYLIELISDDRLMVSEIFLFDSLMRWCLVREGLNQSVNQVLHPVIDQSINQSMKQSSEILSKMMHDRSASQPLTYSPQVHRPLYTINQPSNQSVDDNPFMRASAEECKESMDQSFLPSLNTKKRSYDLIDRSANQSINQPLSHSTSADQLMTDWLIEHIRFPLMSGKELSSIIQPINYSSLLSSEQLIDLFVYINSDRTKPINQSINESIDESFVVRPRVAVTRSIDLKHRFDGDESGLMYWLGTHSINQSVNRSINQPVNQSINQHPFINPSITGEVSIRSSSVAYGSVNQLINRTATQFWTHQTINQSTSQLINQSITLDIDPHSIGRSFSPSKLSLMHGFDKPVDCLINFTFEGLKSVHINQSSNQADESINQSIDQSSEWETLLIRHNCRPCTKGYEYRTFDLPNPPTRSSVRQSINQSINQSYRWFRIRAIGVDSSERTSYLCLGQIEMYGQLTYMDQSMHLSVNQSVNQSINQSNDQSSISQSVYDSSSDSDSELDPIDQPINQPANQSFNQPVNQPTSRVDNSHVTPRNNQIVNRPGNQPVNQQINQSTNHRNSDRCLRAARDTCIIM